ncbi:MAG: hypothetical protein IPK82_36265 [Polyangiaceae bacterium]|nr:hypothetical protein [Polyangiaceae bacterium]
MANVAARMVFYPQTLSNRKNATEPRLDLFLAFPDFYDSAKVRLVVYHLDMYQKSPLLKNEDKGSTIPQPKGGGGVFHKFKQGDLNRAFLSTTAVDDKYGSELNPKLGIGTGVLLKIDGTLFKCKKKEVKAWWLSPRGTPEENTSKPFSVCRFHVATTDEDARSGRVNPKAVGRIILLDDSHQYQWTDHRLAIRMALTHPHAGISEGAVIAASLCPEHNPACPPDDKNNIKNRGVILFDAAAVKSGKPHPIGEDKDKPLVSPTPNPRVMPFDLTGRYEHINGAQDAALVLHLNQAGHALVGWFSLPIPMPAPFAPAPIVGLPAAPGCLWVSSLPNEDKVRGWQFLWARLPNNTVNTMDPDGIDNNPLGGTGWIQETKDPTDASVDAVNLTFEHADGTTSPVLTLRLVWPYPRWPWAIINDPKYFTPEERDLIITDEVRPVATGVWARLRKQFHPDAEIEKGPPQATVASVIRDWKALPQGGNRAGPRGKMATYLGHLIDPFRGLTGDYKHRAAEHIRAGALYHQVKAGDVFDSVYGWLMNMITDYMTWMIGQRQAGIGDFVGKSDAELYERVESGFRDIELVPQGRFIYTMKFKKYLGTEKLPAPNVFWFTVTIKKEVENPDHTRTPEKNWQSHGWEQVPLHGVFGAVGIGLSKGKPGLTGSLPGDTEFYHFADLQLPDFNEATFTVTEVSGPSASVGPAGFSTKTMLVQFRLKNGVRLSAVFEDVGPKVKPALPKKPSWSLFALAGGVGRLLTDLPKADKPPDDTSNDIAKGKDTGARVYALFQRDSAVLEQRNYFERRLAMLRAAFREEITKARVLGYASPEALPDHNRDLSLRRATAVKLAVMDAFHPDIVPSNFDVVAQGETPAIKVGGLLDPPGKTTADKIRIHEEELTKYWIWRVVELWIESILVVRVRPKEEEKGKP